MMHRVTLLAFLLANGANSADMRVQATITSAQPLAVGEPFELVVECFGVEPREAKFPSPPLDLGEFVIVAEAVPTATAASRRFVIVPAISGKRVLPSMPIEITTAAGNVEILNTSPLPVAVRSRFPENATEPIDDLDLMRPPDRSWVIEILAILAGLGITVAVLVALRRRAPRRTRESSIDRGLGLANADLVLNELEARLATEGATAAPAVSLALAELVRDSIASRWAVPARRRTSDEVLSAIRSRSFGREMEPLIARVLEVADAAKYGGTDASLEKARECLAAARSFRNLLATGNQRAIEGA